MKIFIFITTCLAISFSSLANNTGELSPALKKCMAITDNIIRLTCFDDLAKTNSPAITTTDANEKTSFITEKSKVIVQAPPVIKTETPTSKTSQKALEDSFGKQHLKSSEESKKVNFIIAKLSKNARKKWQIVFQNGQVWQQKDELRMSLKTGDKVELAQGVFNVVYLKKINTGKRIKVKRIK